MVCPLPRPSPVLMDEPSSQDGWHLGPCPHHRHLLCCLIPWTPFRSVILLGHLFLLPCIHVCISPHLEFLAGLSRWCHPLLLNVLHIVAAFSFFFRTDFAAAVLCDVFPACLLRRKLICGKIGLERAEMALSEMVVDDFKRKVCGGAGGWEACGLGEEFYHG